jgi:hypothetical protein
VFPQIFRFQAVDGEYKEVKYERYGEDIDRKEILGSNFLLNAEKENGQREGNHPEGKSVRLDQSPASFKVVIEILQSCRYLEARRNKKPANTADAADQDVARNEANNVAQLESPHQPENDTSQHRANCVRCYRSRNDGICVFFSNDRCDCRSHAVEERHNFDLPGK